MNTEGMPLEFELVERETGKIVNVFTAVNFQLAPVYLNEERFVWRQAIGAHDNSGPKQRLYLKDLIGIKFFHPIEVIIGEILWRDFSVYVKYSYGGLVHYVSFAKIVADQCQITRLGSIHDPKCEKLAEKAGLV